MTHGVFTLSGIITIENFQIFLEFWISRNFEFLGRTKSVQYAMWIFWRKSGYFARTKDDALNSLNCHVCHIFDVTCYSMDCRASGVWRTVVHFCRLHKIFSCWAPLGVHFWAFFNLQLLLWRKSQMHRLFFSRQDLIVTMDVPVKSFSMMNSIHSMNLSNFQNLIPSNLFDLRLSVQKLPTIQPPKIIISQNDQN